MKLAVEILKKALEYQIDDLRVNRLMLKDKQNSNEMNIYFKDNIEVNKNKIESIKKAIKYLKTVKNETTNN